MDKITVVHCADLHIGASLSGLNDSADARRAEYLLTLERIIEVCRERGAELLLIAGDLFDTPSVDKETAERVFSLFASIPETTVAISAGNHDPICADSPYKTVALPENVHVFSDKLGMIELKEKNVKVFGISFVSSRFSSHIRFGAAEEESINILVMHADLDGDINGAYNPVSTAVLGDGGMDYVALGHIHKRTEILKTARTYYAYSGCAEPSGFDETGEKGVYVGEIGKDYNTLKFVPLSHRRFEEVKVDITGLLSSAEVVEKALNTLNERYGADYKKNFYKIILTGAAKESFVPDLNYIKTAVSDKVYFAKIKNETTVEVDYKALAGEFTLKGIFVKKMLEKIDSAEDKELLLTALRLGLCAFESEVKPDEA